MNRSIYIHIPFCKKKCSYCDFFSVSSTDSREDIIEGILYELSEYAKENSVHRIQSVYFGGGTPSLLTPNELQSILSVINQKYHLENSEITIECNPESTHEEFLQTAKDLGVNRISLGVQSFNDSLLRALGRLHNAKEAMDVLECIFKVGFKNVSIDLMYAISGFEGDVFQSLKKMQSYPVTHASLYPLEVYDHLSSSKIFVQSDDQAADEYPKIVQELANMGYNQYEVANFSKTGYYSKHNSQYWKPGEYIGIGPSAHGYLDSIRYENHSSIKEYLKSISQGIRPIKAQQWIDSEQKISEYIMLNFRQIKGLDVLDFKNKFSLDFVKKYSDVLLKHQKLGNITIDDKRIRPTSKGLFVINQLLVDLL